MFNNSLMEVSPQNCPYGTVNSSCLFDGLTTVDVSGQNGTNYSLPPAAPAAGGGGAVQIHMLINLPLQMIFGFVSAIANLLTLLALSNVRAKFHPHLLLVVNLTISDMMFGIRTVIFRSLKLAQIFDEDVKQWFAEDQCSRGLIRVVGSSIYLCTYMNLAAMAFDLYFGILMPFSYSKMMTRRKTIILAISFWIVSLLLALANYVVAFFHYLGKFREASYCEIRAMYTKIDMYLYFAVIYVGIVVMTYMYIRIFIEVRRCARYTPGLPVKQVQTVKRKKRKVITSLLVLVTFLIGWLPSGILSTLFFVSPQSAQGTVIHIVGLYLAGLPMMNSICDPVIYAIRLDKVRIGFRKMCGKHRSAFDYCGSEVTEQVSLSIKEPDNYNGSKKSRSSTDKRDYLHVLPCETNGNGLLPVD